VKFAVKKLNKCVLALNECECEKISFYLLDGNIKKARSVLKRIPFAPIRLSEQEIDNIIQKYKK
jgi:hypothetical protein